MAQFLLHLAEKRLEDKQMLPAFEVGPSHICHTAAGRALHMFHTAVRLRACECPH